MLGAYIIVPEHEQCWITSSLRPEHTSQAIPILLFLLAEGGANIIYRLIAVPEANTAVALPSILSKLTLLRIGKCNKSNNDTPLPCLSVFSAKNLVSYLSIPIDASLIHSLNTSLSTLESTQQRPRTRQGDRLALNTSAQLAQDMSATAGQLSLEFKPKWLAQSPSAPDDAKRCRTCALRARRGNKAGFCPLALLGTETQRLGAAEAILAHNGLEKSSAHALADLLGSARELFKTLRDVQVRLDAGGMDSLKVPFQPGREFLMAMTMRDCSLFVRARDADFDPQTTELRLGDFDLKIPSPDRVAYWMDTERELCDEGWYANTEADYEQENVCILRERSK